MSGEDADFVRLGTYALGFELDALQGFLESNGVHLFRQGEHHAALRVNLPSVELLVRRSDLDKARELEQAFHSTTPGHPFRDEHPPLGDDEDDEDDDAPRRSNAAIERAYAAPEPHKDVRRAARLALVPGFGAGSFYARSRFAGALWAALEVAGIALLFSRPLFGGALVLFAVGIDWVHAQSAVRVWNQTQDKCAARRAGEGRLGE